MKALCYVDADHAQAWDQIVLRVITANPPPFNADLHVLKWIEQEATCLCTDAEKCTFAHTKQKAQVLHKQQKAIIQVCLKEDLILL